MAGDEEHRSHSLGEYYKLIRNYPGWRILWIGEILSNLGNWLSYIATLLTVEKLGGGKGIYLSIVLVIHFLPSFALFPIAGVVADRFNRVKVLLTACFVSAGAVALLPIVQRPQELWLLYALLFVEFSTAAFYDPARRALTPSLVPSNILHLATTLDAFAWSFTAAIGASVGGLAASKFGPRTCFLLDSVTYLVAGACAFRLKVVMKHMPKHNPDIELGKQQFDKEVKATGSTDAAAPSNVNGNDIADTAFRIDEDEEAALLPGNRQASEGARGASSDPGSNKDLSEQAPKGCLALILWSVKDEIGDMKEGWNYANNRDNRDVLAMALLKAGGALTWGAADVLNVQYSELPEMQRWGNAAFTLGLFFGSVGVACILGPILFNSFTPPRPRPLLLASATTYFFLWMGYLGMSLSHSIVTMCLSIMWRSFGSAVAWMYSTLLLQLRVPDHLLGRMLALEMAFFTVAESASGVFGGVALDDLGLDARQTTLIMAGTGFVLSIVWLHYAVRKWRTPHAFYN